MQFTSAVIFLFFSFSAAQSFDQPELAVSYEPAQEQQEQVYAEQQPEERQFIDVYTDPETGLYYEYNDQDDTFYQVAPSELEFYPVDEEQAQAFENALQAEYAASAASDEEDAEYGAEQDFSGAQEDQEYEDDQDFSGAQDQEDQEYEATPSFGAMGPIRSP